MSGRWLQYNGLILKGMLAHEGKLKKDLEEGKVIPGGCCVSNDDSFFASVDCKTDF